MATRRISFPVEYFNPKQAADGTAFEGTFLDTTEEMVEYQGQRWYSKKHRIRKSDLSYVILSGGNLDRDLAGLPSGTHVKVVFVAMEPGKNGKPVARYEVEADVPENWVPTPVVKKKAEETAPVDEPPPF